MDATLEDQWIAEDELVQFEGREWIVDSIRAKIDAVSRSNSLLYGEAEVRLLPMQPQGSEGGRWVSTTEVFHERES